VIDRVKERIQEISPGLPAGMEIKPAYDRSDIIVASVKTLTTALIEEGIVVSIVVFLFLLHFRSVLRIIIEIPIAVLVAFICMKVFGITSNIMSLGGIAIAIGVIVDASIVLGRTPTGMSRGRRRRARSTVDFTEISIPRPNRLGGRSFAVAIMVVSFLPVFLLEGQEGKMFRPLAFTRRSSWRFGYHRHNTRTDADGGTHERKIPPENQNPIPALNRSVPVIRLVLK
jgi:Cu(I)/Ag(I) efflux system membrane protein CusA/SilA